MTRPNELSEFNGFDPDAIAILHRAYTETCIVLHVFAGDRDGQEAIASRVIDLAKRGVIDARVLRERIVLEARLAA
jgi:hypothetical protein